MKNQKCPACGAALENHMTVCPDCGLDGLNQFFLSKEAYLDWYEREVIPQQDRIRNPQVFAGARHFLILLGSGDLYAVGDNWSDACGVDLPRKLIEPVRIARNVKHAAAGENHTVYITQDKKVKIIGNSDLVDRFRCDLRAEYVFSNGSDTFYLEAEDGKWYGFGDNEDSQITPQNRQCVKSFEERTIHFQRRHVWSYIWSCHTPQGGRINEYIYGEKDDALTPIQNGQWYRSLVKEHGERNIVAEDVLLQETETLAKEYIHARPTDGWGDEAGEKLYDQVRVYQVKVYLENRMIYEPVPCQIKVDANRPYRYFGGKGYPVERAETVLQGYQKQYFGRDWIWQDIVSLYKTGDILLLKRLGTAVPYLQYPSIGRAIDFAWSAHSGRMIVATRDGEIFWGNPIVGVERLERFRICENVSWKL
ncbi:MAG: hypothetical protein IKY96_07565 [Oscillospiraceae bacterium]|nr:hypothetical protein [Oscillospiraceae bacterium]